MKMKNQKIPKSKERAFSAHIVVKLKMFSNI